MDRTIRKVEDERSQLIETLRYWRSSPDYERMEAVANIIRESYASKGIDVDAQSYPKTLTRIHRSRMSYSGEDQ